MVQGLSYVVRLNDLKTAQHLRARLALVLRHPSGLAKPLHAELKELLEISGAWVRNVGNRHDTKQHIQRLIQYIIAPLKSPLAPGKLAAVRAPRVVMRQSLEHPAQPADRGEPRPYHRRRTE